MRRIKANMTHSLCMQATLSVVFLTGYFVGSNVALSDANPVCPNLPNEMTFIAYPHNCSKYWQCYEGKEILMECPNDFYWNRKTNSCDYRENVFCSENHVPPPPQENSSSTQAAYEETSWTPNSLCPYPSDVVTYYAYSGDCSKYWQCYDGNKHLASCPSGSYWDRVNQTCVHKKNVDCSPDVPSASRSRFSRSDVSWEPDPLCPYPSDIITYYVYPYDCSKYWECYAGNKYLMDCPSNLYWNHFTDTCDYKENVDCSRETSSTKKPVTTPPSSKIEPWTPDPLCPYPSDVITYYDYPYDCSKYWECYAGNKYLMSCPENLYWNHFTDTCDYKENVDCSRKPPTTKRPITNPPIISSTPSHGNACTNIPDGSLVPNPDDCASFFECSGHQPIPMICPPGTLFDKHRRICDNWYNVSC